MKPAAFVATVILTAACAALASPSARAQTTHLIIVDKDGSYSPQTITIRNGDEVVWAFPDYSRAVVRLEGDTAELPACDAYAPYEHGDPYEFTGPMPEMASGIFALGPTGPGLGEYDLGDPAATCPDDPSHRDTIYVAGGRKLCKETETSPANAVLQSTLDDPAVTGVFLRFDWNKLEIAPGEFDWTVLDREVERIVKAGKLYSIAIKAAKAGTPEWLFDELNLPPLYLEDGGSELAEGECGFSMKLADPTDPPYGQRYGQMLAAVADHLKRKSAFYRGLSMIKASGANLITHENRLPKRCIPGCPICNTWVWAANGYTPQGLYDFYMRQFAHISANFPAKSMSYMLIQAGYPRVRNEIEYLGCVTDECESNLPGGIEQTSQIIDLGADLYPRSLAIAHNGLRSAPSPGTCNNYQIHPADLSPGDGKPPKASDYTGKSCPNPHVLRKGAEGSVTGFQTVNRSKVNTLQQLDQTLQNGLDNSDAVYVEVYEEMIWLAGRTGGTLDPQAAQPRSLGAWAEVFHGRRRDSSGIYPWSKILDDPFPPTHSHKFVSPVKLAENRYFHFADPSTCGPSKIPAIGTIIIEPS